MYPKLELYAIYSHFKVTSDEMTSLPVTLGEVTSFPVMWRRPRVSCSPVRSQTYSKLDWQAFYSHFQVTSGQMTSLLGYLRSRDVRDVISCQVTASSCELQPCMSSNVPKTQLSGLLQSLQGAFRLNDIFRVTSGHVMSRDVISCHVTATSCELQPCRSSNVPKSRITGLLQPLPGDFRSNDVTSSSLPVTWGYVMSFPVTWLPPPVS